MIFTILGADKETYGRLWPLHLVVRLKWLEESEVSSQKEKLDRKWERMRTNRNPHLSLCSSSLDCVGGLQKKLASFTTKQHILGARDLQKPKKMWEN